MKGNEHKALESEDSGQSTDFSSPFTYTPIGIVHSPFSDLAGMPIQPSGAKGIKGTIEIRQEFIAGLRDVEEFSHLILIYAFHRCQGYSLEVTPFLDPRSHGVFATRAPKRPNAIGLSIVQLTGIKGTILAIEDVDILDGTPLLDIKPYVPAFDSYSNAKAGWLDGVSHHAAFVRSDERFH
ncbi:MAG TPA: tRNA (N6-threonylcarbamoyladenosine(37)-N6)-methyltransferase TrmO [Methanoregulaceae archaeon]|jgi:tRNA-Thr(GGU) m(6)t(6)A37 methyltransferase TsaA|nr:tRNA (N6-threonylcarbamoyladenosine(37)-N6)-methyltransferase TrmO [Methanomicrobiales archaeon]HNB02903.1 tRNA (N6-threonylcarbamoyladenosine(37)-N6)-methyltransferase TrmO [Methanoregulaceae archaeon]HNI41964.1 tRNA (N6-threonylcarbamoyladenosine(37)-N6)-methyltransferase TrmO [Methanoregulaceae archaeon]HOU80212.1 tRNA (N6-threonylcarbamoyladenosine(37)-N6)-methyltransferase TrmO [Methanoregulaceae archaeon]HPS23867.1 tRNA (N6-threonylcarbamoyladenosine(37)-N6)-methyltransferase TrmO [Met